VDTLPRKYCLQKHTFYTKAFLAPSSPGGSSAAEDTPAPPPVKKANRKVIKTKVIDNDGADLVLPAEEEEAETSADERAEDEGEEELELDEAETKAASKK
jgi:hypothetical protein